MSKKADMEKMLFDYQTINKTDYQKIELKEPVQTVYKPKETCLMVRPRPLKDVHTMSDWKTIGIPFDLLHKERPIVGTDPRKVQQPYEKPPDPGRKDAQRTRPRLVMTPAVSMDDIEDDNARNILVQDMYTTDTKKGQQEAISPYFRVAAPFPGHPAPANPIVLPKLEAPYVSPEWRMETVTWDSKQLRSYCDPTREFWLSRPLTKCRACDENAIVKAHRQMKGKH